MQQIKLLVLDMDGTSYHTMGEIVKENIRPLQELIKTGTKVAFVTGRPVLAKANKLLEHKLSEQNTILIGCNGGCIYDVKTDSVIQTNLINGELAKQVFELAVDTKVLIWGYVDDLKTVVLSRKILSSEECHWEENFFDGDYVYYEDVKQNFHFSFFKLLGFNGNNDLYTKLASDFNLNIATNDGKIAEINAAGINKKYAVEWLSNYFGIPVGNIAAIGDGMNDLSMIEYAGVGVAIKNSQQKIKDIANIYIDLSNTEAAVGYFISEYLLKQGEENNES